MKKIKWILVLTAVIAMGACSKNDPSSDKFINSPEELLERNEAAVLDTDGMPIFEATVHIGNQVVTTNSSGVFRIPSNWKSPQPVTIEKAGYVKTTYLEQMPQGQVYTIKTRTPAERIEVKGSISGFGNLPRDGYIDFGLAVATLEPKSALNFNISQIISDESDTVSVLGQKLDIPTNVFVPKQRESYGFISVTIEKAFYRLFYDFPGTYTAQATLGRFEFKKVADKLKGGQSFFEVVNDFELNSVGTASFVISKPNEALNIQANTTKLIPAVDFITPMPKSGLLFGLTMIEKGTMLQPSDIKVRENKKQMLLLPENIKTSKILLVNADKITNKDSSELSESITTTLVDSTNLPSAVLLDRVQAPKLANNALQLDVPKATPNVRAFATYVALSNVSKHRQNNVLVQSSDTEWEIYSAGWIDSIDLPEITNVHPSQRWQVGFYGIDSHKQTEFTDAQSLNEATHAVHNAVHF